MTVKQAHSHQNINIMFERSHHEKQKQKLIEEITTKILTIKDLKSGCTDYPTIQYYNGYIQAYNDCIDLIIEDKNY